MPRPAFKIDTENPGSDLAAETAAALAASSIFYRSAGQDSKAEEALEHARQLFDFANKYRGKYSNSIPSVQDYYE